MSAIAAQSRAAKYAKKRSAAWLAAFSSRRVCACSSSKRASAASRSASSKISTRLSRSPSTVKIVDHPPLGVKALLRGPFQHLGDDGSEFVEPMHGLDVDAEVRSDVPHGTKSCGQISPLDRYERSMIDVNRIRSRRGKFVPIERGVGPCNHRPRVARGRPLRRRGSGRRAPRRRRRCRRSRTRRAPTIRSSASISATPSHSAPTSPGGASRSKART